MRFIPALSSPPSPLHFVEGGVENKRFGRRGVTLVEVLIVVAIMAVIAGGATMLVFPAYKRAKIESATVGATQVKQAALLWQSETDGDACPTVKDLVDDKKLEARRTDDPFGTPYRVECEGEQTDDLHGYSNGRDKKEGSPDDIRDDFKKADIDRVAEL